MKKVAGSWKHSKQPDSAEFSDYKQRLDNVVKALEATSASTAASQKVWKTLAADQAKAVENYMNMYPDDDDVRNKARDAVAASSKVTADFTKSEDSGAPANVIDKHVKQYLAEIKSLQTEYKKLGSAKVDYDMYGSKVQSLEGSKKQDETKIERNRTKLEEARINYESILEATIKRQKELYAKRQTLFKAGFVSYWLSQGTYIAFLSGNYANVVRYAKENESTMMALDVNSIRDENTPVQV